MIAPGSLYSFHWSKICIDILEETAMLKVESFHSRQVGGDAADVRAVVASTTQQANETLAHSNRSERFPSHRYIPILIGAKTRKDIHVS
jgi:hypothetical protein